jgi:hypothetical protein
VDEKNYEWLITRSDAASASSSAILSATRLCGWLNLRLDTVIAAVVALSGVKFGYLVFCLVKYHRRCLKTQHLGRGVLCGGT